MLSAVLKSDRAAILVSVVQDIQKLKNPPTKSWPARGYHVRGTCVLSDVYVSYAFSGIKIGSVHAISPASSTGPKPRFLASATGFSQNFAD
jgi:uncharacterized protein with NRDE domain